jgi:hypothetical protein
VNAAPIRIAAIRFMLRTILCEHRVYANIGV